MNPLLLSDTYKQVHNKMYPDRLTKLVSYWLPRRSMIQGQEEMVFFGLRYFMKEFLVDYFKRNFFKKSIEELMEEYSNVMGVQLGIENVNMEHMIKLHKLGYLPIEIRALDEGTFVPMGVPCIEVRNTHSDFAWLTQWVECMLQTELWKLCNYATIAAMYYTIAKSFCDVSAKDMLPSETCSEFGMRGMSGLDEAMKCAAAWSLFFGKTSTIPVINWLNKYYEAELSPERREAGKGAVSTEHSVMSANFAVDGNEITFVKKLLTTLYPYTSFSMVSDTYDYWNMVEHIIPACKKEILEHNGKLLIRPDSGDMRTIAVDTVKKLWDIFGGTVNEQGFKVLDPHIGVIYGDACTQSNVYHVWSKLVEDGFAASNIVFGVGAWCFAHFPSSDGKFIVNTRDTFGIAMKATYGELEEKPIQIYKDPATDTSGLKKSHKGVCFVKKDETGRIFCEDNHTLNDVCTDNLLKLVFKDGQIVETERAFTHWDAIQLRLLKELK